MSRFSSNERFSYRDKRTSQKRITKTILIILALFFSYQIFNAIGFSTIKVVGSSMYPSLEDGDLIIYRKYLFPSDKLLTKNYIKNGDVVLIETPYSKNKSVVFRSIDSIIGFITFQKVQLFNENFFWEKSMHFKRAILLPKDSLTNSEGINMITLKNNDYSMSEFESNKHDYDIIEPKNNDWNSTYPLGSNINNITISPGKVWVLSDNRLNNNDSRNWHQVDSSEIKGKALLCYWPIRNFGIIR